MIVHIAHKWAIEASQEVQPLKSHNASDLRSRAYGDVEIWCQNAPAILIEVKHLMDISLDHIVTFGSKVNGLTHPTRNFILSSRPGIEYSVQCGIVIWNVAAYVHSLVAGSSAFIDVLFQGLMQSMLSYDIKVFMQQIFT